MKKILLLLSLACSFVHAADVVTPRIGIDVPAVGTAGPTYATKINNAFSILDSSVAVLGSSNTYTSSNTFNNSIINPTISAGSCITVDANGKEIGQSCGGSGGATALAVFVGGVQVSSPTAVIRFSTNTFKGSLVGSATAQLDLLQTTTYFIQNTSSRQSSAVLNLSSGTVDNLYVTTLTFTVGGTTQTMAINTGSFIGNQSTLQSATFNVSSGTANAFAASTATVYNLLQVKGTGLTGSSVGFQAMGSTFNVTANGRVGIGTAVPGNTLDVRGDMSISTITASSGTLITFNSSVSSISTLNVGNGGATLSHVDINNGGLFFPTQDGSQTLFFRDIGTAGDSHLKPGCSGFGGCVFDLSNTVFAPGTFGANQTYRFVTSDSSGYTSNYDLLNGTQTFTGQQSWTSSRPSTFTALTATQFNLGSSGIRKVTLASAPSCTINNVLVGGCSNAGGTTTIAITSNTASNTFWLDTNGKVSLGTIGPNQLNIGGESYLGGTGAYPLTGVSNTTIQGTSTESYSLRVGVSTSSFHVVISTSGHFITSASTTPAVSSCGTQPTISGDDNQGTITFGTGSPTACTMTFITGWGATPNCTFNEIGAAGIPDISSISQSAITFTVSITGTGVSYLCSCSGSSCR